MPTGPQAFLGRHLPTCCLGQARFQTVLASSLLLYILGRVAHLLLQVLGSHDQSLRDL